LGSSLNAGSVRQEWSRRFRAGRRPGSERIGAPALPVQKSNDLSALVGRSALLVRIARKYTGGEVLPKSIQNRQGKYIKNMKY